MANPQQRPELETYLDRRMRFARRHRGRWPGTIVEPYDLLEPHPIGQKDLVAIGRATRGVCHIYRRTAQLLMSMPYNVYESLGIPPETITLSQALLPARDLLYARLDLVPSQEGYRLLECNFDVPGLLVETFSINELACDLLCRPNPNRRAKLAFEAQLSNELRASATYLGKSLEDCVTVVCSRRAYTRDRDVAKFLLEAGDAMGSRRLQLQFLDELRCDAHGLYDHEDRRIDILIRVYPLHWLCQGAIADRNVRGNFLDCRQLLGLLTERRLSLINSPFSSVLESKGIQALIWALYENGSYFDGREQEIIRRHFLPTYFHKPNNLGKLVRKPMYGREGSSIMVLDAAGTVLEASEIGNQTDEPAIFQQHIDIPSQRLMTEAGMLDLRVITSALAIDGRTVGVCYRAGMGITSASWWVMPAYFDSCDLPRVFGPSIS